MRLRRREFIVGGVAAAVAGATCSTVIARAMHTGYGADRYERAMVIDAQAKIGEPDGNLPLEGSPSERLKRDLRESGLAAVSMTLSVGSIGDRMAIATRKIAIFDEKVASAAELLMRIRTAADLKATRTTHRLGLIFNLQDSSLLENDLSRVTLCQRMGIRVMQLTQLVVEYNEPRRFLHLAEDLSARGWPARRIDKLLGENFARVFSDVWG